MNPAATALAAILCFAPPASNPAQPPAPPTPPASPASPTAPRVDLVRPADLVTAQRGDLPIILSAPHGGGVRVPGSADRTRAGVVVVRDVRTAECALLSAQRITERLGAKPYYVIAQFSRRDADANRDAGDPVKGGAYENPAATAAYDAYHAALRTAVDECRDRFGVAILIDLHGQVRQKEAIVRGTRNGKTVAGLIARHGQEALVGPDSIAGKLRALGYTMIPDPLADAAEPEEGAGRETFFDGGWIVAHYGSQNADGVDAIQLELGAQRTNDLLKLSRDIGDSVAAFFDAYLKPDVKPGSLPERIPGRIAVPARAD